MATIMEKKQPIVTENIENFDAVFLIIDSSELVGHKLLKHKPENI